MDYGMISEIAKAQKYTDQRHRIRFSSFEATMIGDNSTHLITYEDGVWDCQASFFDAHGWSAHTVALERILQGMIQAPVPAPTKAIASQSSLISQTEKAKKYTDEPGRVKFNRFVVAFEGDHHTHHVTFENGQLSCSCEFFKKHGWSSHTIAVERILKGMISVTPHIATRVN
jgi:hypothetical protein